jgi:hypothetical protein
MRHIILSIGLLFSLLKTFSQQAQYASYGTTADTIISITTTAIVKNKPIDKQLALVTFSHDLATIKFFSGHRVKLLPKDELGKTDLEIAKTLLKTKDLNKLPVEYKPYLAIKINDSNSLFKLTESYTTEQSFMLQKTELITCLNICKTNFIKIIDRQKQVNQNSRTKVEFVEDGKKTIYFIDGRLNSKKLLKCLFANQK